MPGGHVGVGRANVHARGCEMTGQLRRRLSAIATIFLFSTFGDAWAAPPRVLLLGDSLSERQVQRALENAGHDVVFGGLYYEWDGVTPNVNDFDVVIYLDGYDYGYLLDPVADAALSAFVAGGGGLIITEWSAYDAAGTWNPLVGALMPVTSPDRNYDYGGPWYVVDPAHRLAAWLPDRWGDAAAYGYVVPIAGATVVFEGIDGHPLVTYRTDTGGTVIHVNHDMTYTTSRIHPNALRVLVNAVEFAASQPPAECNDNGVADFLDFANGDGTDVNDNQVLDECDPDCNDNGTPDDLDVLPPSPFSDVPFVYDTTSTEEWNYVNSCDDCVTEEIALPFAVTLGGETLTHFTQSSNGYVELLREGELAYDASYGRVWDLIGSGTPHHTFLMAAYDDLSSSSVGGYGYRTEPGAVTFYWETPTYADSDGTTLWVNFFQIVLRADGTLQWNFASQGVVSYDNDLYTGIYLGYGVNELYQLAAGTIPVSESRVFTGPAPPYSEDENFNGVPDECDLDCNNNGISDDFDVALPTDPGLAQRPFRFETPVSLAWTDACDTCDSGTVALPFSVTLGGEMYTSFVQYSDGYVELLHAGELPYAFHYGPVADLIADDGGTPGGPTHTYLMAAFDDLDSEYQGVFGYTADAERMLFYWRTETYEDDDDGALNEFEICVTDHSIVHWNFNYAYYVSFGYDLFSGIYLGFDSQVLHEIIRNEIPEFQSWIFSETGQSGGGSEDANGNGIPDECEGKGDMDDNGVVNLADLPGFVACLRGPDVTVESACGPADMTDDLDVDLEDVAKLFMVFDAS